jgi:2-succinyl-5-enolpyruvyl-6-hydroxy-3-cyclohexene-1-carboxylate synthase
MENLAAAWCRLFVRALVEAGVLHVVVSPGSRSTPLTLAVAAEVRLRAHLVIDERTAGFVALGLARASERPVALVCTSGTAAAHYFPAVIEASEAHVPLIVVTADRPWEAYDCGASQTMDQTRLFGVHVRHFAELGLPDETAGAWRAVGRIAHQAVRFSQHPTPGPVHVNARFRKPLEPTSLVDEAAWPALVRTLLDSPLTSVGAPPPLPPPPLADEATLDRFVELLTEAREGVIAVGPLPPSARHLAPLVKQLAYRLGFPLLAESTSQLLAAAPTEPMASEPISCFEPLLSAPAIKDKSPDLFVEVGRPLVSTAYLALRERHAGANAVRLADHGWNDPTGRGLPLLGSVESLLRGALARLPATARAPSALARRLAGGAEIVRAEVARTLASVPADSLGEGQAVRSVLAALPAAALLVVGNSTPVRDVDLFGGGLARDVRVLHQRGVAGIDGFVASTFGAALALDDVGEDEGGAIPVVCLLGDVTLAHDLGSLAVARLAKRPVVFVAIDNGGGRIFDELPLARRPELSEPFGRYFTTPPTLPFVAIARAFGVAADSVRTAAALDDALALALRRPGVTVLVAEVETAAYGAGGSPRRALTAAVHARLLAAAAEVDK